MSRLGWVNSQLDGKQYLLGDDFSVADGYLFVVTHWTAPLGIDIRAMRNRVAYRARASRPR